MQKYAHMKDCISNYIHVYNFFNHFSPVLFADVPIWLKNLRLHKYAYLFQQMNYAEMLGLTEDWLEEQVSIVSKFIVTCTVESRFATLRYCL